MCGSNAFELGEMHGHPASIGLSVDFIACILPIIVMQLQPSENNAKSYSHQRVRMPDKEQTEWNQLTLCTWTPA